MDGCGRFLSYLTHALAVCFVAVGIVAFVRVAATRTANRITPPGCRARLVQGHFAVIARRVALATAFIAAAIRRVDLAGGVVLARIVLANVGAIRADESGIAGALVRIPGVGAGAPLRTYIALGRARIGRAAAVADSMFHRRFQPQIALLIDSHILDRNHLYIQLLRETLLWPRVLFYFYELYSTLMQPMNPVELVVSNRPRTTLVGIKPVNFESTGTVFS